MLQAESSCAKDWNVSNLPVEPSHRIKGRKMVYKVNHKRKLYIKSTAIVFGYALILVFLCMKSATLGYQIETLQQDVQNIETSNQRLEYQIAEKSSLPRVEQVASTQLGMYKPDVKTSIALDVQTEPVQVASTSTDATADKSLSQEILNKMYSSLSRLALNNK
jgi:cell division protein FtsL